MNLKLSVYVECPTCRGSGVVKGAIRSSVDCKGRNCVNGYVTVLVTRDEMNAILRGDSTIDGQPGSFSAKPTHLPSGRPIPGRV